MYYFVINQLILGLLRTQTCLRQWRYTALHFLSYLATGVQRFRVVSKLLTIRASAGCDVGEAEERGQLLVVPHEEFLIPPDPPRGAIVQLSVLQVSLQVLFLVIAGRLYQSQPRQSIRRAIQRSRIHLPRIYIFNLT